MCFKLTPKDVTMATDQSPDSMNTQAPTVQESVRAESVTISQGGAQTVEATYVEVHQGGIGAVRAQDVRIQEGVAGLVQAEQVTVRESQVGVLVANQLHSENTRGVVIVARQIDGDVQTLMDLRGMIAAGAALGVVFALLMLLGRKGKG